MRAAKSEELIYASFVDEICMYNGGCLDDAKPAKHFEATNSTALFFDGAWAAVPKAYMAFQVLSKSESNVLKTFVVPTFEGRTG